ncbi:molybdopterin molybdochelatase [Anaerobranca californiensis DSM 14826]|jgi:molybdopterin molybdotransferase|uniref:Molybdopterin molybdenumtransferase n=1 Tax=Anaerobranca californiensis DSM 14826 TaxID=1120989 RepID=A0A1M6S0J5_9FIRM|nr:gephyrin-like molybdotransferase Glp [Anaerobranca californiensis]SHK38342.1 molybdopterin molybdochelatase [Anaerobranca californiensis DSM 14826]
MNTNIQIKSALEMLITEVKPKSPVSLNLVDALGYVLAEDIFSPLNIPPFDRSPLDGFALRACDTLNATKEQPTTFKVIDFAPAGKPSTKILGPYQAIRIMTGAKIPDGADLIVPFEETEFTEEWVKVFKTYKSNSNITFKGEDIKKGQRVLVKGDLINPPEIGILASIGKNEVLVYDRPKVAILSTGDELVDVNQPLEEGKIPNSNSYTIAALVKRAGGIPYILPHCPDHLEKITKEISSTLKWADILVTTGGVSVGDKDYVMEAFQRICDKFLFWKVKMKPGTPITAAKYKDKLMIGLSGNPAAAFITFEIFVKPIIKKFRGLEKIYPLELESTLLSNFTKVRNQNRFVRAITYYDSGNFYTKLPDSHSSGVISSLTKVNSLFFIPAGAGPFTEGQKIKVQLLEGEDLLP